MGMIGRMGVRLIHELLKLIVGDLWHMAKIGERAKKLSAGILQVALEFSRRLLSKK